MTGRRKYVEERKRKSGYLINLGLVFSANQNCEHSQGDVNLQLFSREYCQVLSVPRVTMASGDFAAHTSSATCRCHHLPDVVGSFYFGMQGHLNGAICLSDRPPILSPSAMAPGCRVTSSFVVLSTKLKLTIWAGVEEILPPAPLP